MSELFMYDDGQAVVSLNVVEMETSELLGTIEITEYDIANILTNGVGGWLKQEIDNMVHIYASRHMPDLIAHFAKHGRNDSLD